MFSGGLLSSNLTRSFGKIRNRTKSSSSKKSVTISKESKKISMKSRAKLQKEFCLNWDETEEIEKNNPNSNPTYTLEVKGKVQLASYAGCLLLFGLAILLLGALFTHLFEKIFGPIAIGVGIYAVMIAICWLLDNRDRGKRFYHIQDLYSKYASRKFQKIVGKNAEVNQTKTKLSLKSNPSVQPQKFDDEPEQEDLTNIPETSLLLGDDEMDDHKDDVAVTEQDFSSDIEEAEEPKPRKIHPELIKRLSMRQLTYDITFKQPPLKVTDC